MPRYRSFDVGFKRQVAQEFLTGQSLNSLSRKYDIARNLIRIWVLKHEGGEFEPEFEHESRLKAHEVKIAGLERMVGKLTMELEFLRGGRENTNVTRKRAYIDRHRPDGLSVRRGCELMNLARSTFYDDPAGQSPGDAKVVQKIGEICAEYPRYGYRRVTAQLRRDGLVVNHKRAMRIMREEGRSVRPRRRFVATTDSTHNGPIFPNLARDLALTGPNQLWVADLTFIAITRGFVDLSVLLDAWSRRVVGYAAGRSHPIDPSSSPCRHREPPSAGWMHPSFGPRCPICRRVLPQSLS